MKKSRGSLESIGWPGGDFCDFPTSEKRFLVGGQKEFYAPDLHLENSKSTGASFVIRSCSSLCV